MKTLRKHARIIGITAVVVMLVRHEILLASLRADIDTLGQVLFQLLTMLGLI